MNNKTRNLAKLAYDLWRDEVLCYAPPDCSYIPSFEHGKREWMRKAVKIKKTLEYRRGYHELSW